MIVDTSYPLFLSIFPTVTTGNSATRWSRLFSIFPKDRARFSAAFLSRGAPGVTFCAGMD